jgi:hypothetical protein
LRPHGEIAASGQDGHAGEDQEDGPVRETVVALKGASEWKAWLDEFADPCRLGLADTIEQSLLSYAKQRGFRDLPKR